MSRTRLISVVALLAVLAASVLLVACGGGDGSSTGASADRSVIAVTTPVLGAVVADAVGDRAEVRVVMPNGSDPHEWRPSARDVATLQDADLIVQNGLGLEEGLTKAVQRAREAGVPVFTATDHVRVRHVEEGAGDHDHAGDADHGGEGAADPHFWTDPAQMRAVVLALPSAVRSATGADVTASARREAAALAALDRRLAARAKAIPAGSRTLVTGHESLGYLADRYGLRVVGAVTPSLSSQGQVSAAHLAALSDAMREAGTRVVFAETGTPEQVARAVSDEAGATLVQLPSHALPADGRYTTFLEDTMERISTALSGRGA